MKIINDIKENLNTIKSYRQNYNLIMMNSRKNNNRYDLPED